MPPPSPPVSSPTARLQTNPTPPGGHQPITVPRRCRTCGAQRQGTHRNFDYHVIRVLHPEKNALAEVPEASSSSSPSLPQPQVPGRPVRKPRSSSSRAVKGRSTDDVTALLGSRSTESLHTTAAVGSPEAVGPSARSPAVLEWQRGVDEPRVGRRRRVRGWLQGVWRHVVVSKRKPAAR